MSFENELWKLCVESTDLADHVYQLYLSRGHSEDTAQELMEEFMAQAGKSRSLIKTYGILKNETEES